MNKLKVVEGENFGRLTVLKEAFYKTDGSRYPRTYVTCKCDCGNIKDMPYCRIRNGTIFSCGCYNKEVTKALLQTHKMSNTKLYYVYREMIQRCCNPNNKGYKNYGGRGISICEDWRRDFINFYKWAISNGYEEGLSIDRIDVDGNYEPSNCRWATAVQQSNNLRNNVIINYKGHCGTIAEVARALGIKYGVLYMRLFRSKYTNKEERKYGNTL